MIKIKMKRSEYERTESGKSWKTKPVETETREVDELFYKNFTAPETSKFFRRLGGYEKREKDYTSYGFRVVRVVSISPDRSIKIETQFSFR